MKTKNLLLKSSLVLAFGMFNSNTIEAQISGANAYLKGNYVEIGIDGLQGNEGAPFDSAASALPAGLHFRSHNAKFGFMANPQMDSWTNYDGDFFTPGSPENGWGLKINGALRVNNAENGGFGLADTVITGSITSWAHTGTLTTTSWEGTDTITGIKVNIDYSLGDNDLFYITTVTVTNTSPATIKNIYYYRNLDPDNNVMLSGSFTTDQLLNSQFGSCPGCYAQVTATQTAPWASYFSFLANDSIMKAGFGGFSNRDGEDLYNGTGFTQTVGATNTADEAIYLAYKIDSLTAGGSHKSSSSISDASSRVFRFASLFKGTAVFAAQNALQASASVGINELQNSNNSIAIYPNPFEDNTTINLNPTINLSKAEFQIYDIMGKQIIALPVTTHNFTFNKGEMAQGLYFYKLVNNGSELSTGKFLVK